MKNPALSRFSVCYLPRLLWGAALLTIPVTSFRWFPLLGEGTVVRPLALYPLALLLTVLLLQAWKGRNRLYFPAAFLPLAVFVLFTLVSAALGGLIDPIPLRGQEYSGRALRAIVTLLIGISFFVSAAWMNRDRDDLLFSMKWILGGLILDLAWSGLQAVTFY